MAILTRVTNAVHRRYGNSKQLVVEALQGKIDDESKFKNAFNCMQHLLTKLPIEKIIDDYYTKLSDNDEDKKEAITLLNKFGNGANPAQLKKSVVNVEPIFDSVFKEIILSEINDYKSNGDFIGMKRDVTKLISYEAYGESSPQAILQSYTLWKRPLICFSWTDNGKIISFKYKFRLIENRSLDNKLLFLLFSHILWIHCN